MTEDPGTVQPLKISDELVSALVKDQFPELSHLDVGRHHTLEDHVSIRLGETHGAILPTVPGLDGYFSRVVDLLAPRVSDWTFPWSAPIRTGTPGHGYPYHWVIVPWITASTAAFVPLRADAARELGSALRQLHHQAPDDAPTSPFTSQSLPDLATKWQDLLHHVSQIAGPEERSLDARLAQSLWDNALDAWTEPRRTWTHGNLEPRAILSDQGHFAGLLLWHCYSAGNPEVDLGTLAILIPTDARYDMFDAYGGVKTEAVTRIQAFELLAAFRYIKHGDPFRARLAWERLIELGLVSTP